MERNIKNVPLSMTMGRSSRGSTQIGIHSIPTLMLITDSAPVLHLTANSWDGLQLRIGCGNLSTMPALCNLRLTYSSQSSSLYVQFIHSIPLNAGRFNTFLKYLCKFK